MTVVIEADEAGRLTLPAEVLGEAKPHGKYVVEAVGTRVLVEPEGGNGEKPRRLSQEESDEWMRKWRELSDEIGKVWPEGVSAADVVSEMRR